MTNESTTKSGSFGLCPIILASDDAYGMPLATTLRSLVDSNPDAWPVTCFVLSNGITEKTRSKVLASLPENSIRIQWLEVDLSVFGKFLTLSHISKMTYARFLIPRLISHDVGRVLYLDSDLLVFDDLRPLCGTDLGDGVMGAVQDPFMDQAIKQDRAGYEGVPRVRCYFNAGVLLIDLHRWREQRIAEKAIQYLNDRPDTPYSDQDALNVACDGRWHHLGSRWNFQRHDLVIRGDSVVRESPAIIHFTTEEKPWIARHLSPSADLYDSFRCRTCFARTRWNRFCDFCVRLAVRFKLWLSKCAPLRAVWRFLKRNFRAVLSRGKAEGGRRRTHSLTS